MNEYSDYAAAKADSFKESKSLVVIYFPSNIINSVGHYGVKFSIIKYYTIFDGLSKFGGTVKVISMVISIILVPIFVFFFKKEKAQAILEQDPEFHNLD